MNNTVNVVCGPTATGKTDFAIELAKRLNGELISADSRQVYRGVPIVTNQGELRHVTLRQVTLRQAQCDTRQAQCDTRKAQCDTRQAQCDTRQAQCDTRQAQSDTRQAQCDTRQAQCDKGEAKCDNFLAYGGVRDDNHKAQGKVGERDQLMEVCDTNEKAQNRKEHVKYNENKYRRTSKLARYKTKGVPIHLVNFLDLNEQFSVFDWKNLAENTVLDITSRGKIPIIVGGTGLYIDALIKQYSLEDQAVDINFRDKLNSKSLEELQNEMRKISVSTWKNLNESDQQNPRRLIRLIERFRFGDRLKSFEESGKKVKRVEIGKKTFEIKMYYPSFDWEDLKAKIHTRVDKMFEEGLVNEVTSAFKKYQGMGFSTSEIIGMPGFQIMGAREIIEIMDKKTLKVRNEYLPSIKEKIETVHRQYAKRQRTWFEGKGRVYNLEKF